MDLKDIDAGIIYITSYAILDFQLRHRLYMGNITNYTRLVLGRLCHTNESLVAVCFTVHLLV